MKLKTLSMKAQSPPPEEGPHPQANPQEENSRRTPAQEGVSTQSEPQENIQPQETGKNLDVRA